MIVSSDRYDWRGLPEGFSGRANLGDAAADVGGDRAAVRGGLVAGADFFRLAGLVIAAVVFLPALYALLRGARR